ncbi:MAG: penicillin-binding protein 1A [Pseudomonadota bacterium]|nr:penicillin-binding protein 1A [Pseudomonadota bacterium]
MQLLLKSLTKLLSLALVLVVTLGVGFAVYTVSLLKDLPSIEQLREIQLSVPLRIYSGDNLLIGEYGNERRIPIKIADMPAIVTDAVLAAEDDNFYQHPGVDFGGIARAALSNLQSGSHGQGASTITMQVARNFFLSREKTYTRKLKEILLAFSMERSLSKDEILELYINKIFLGHRAYGFGAAAQVYYGRALKDLSLPEIAMLAGLPKAPSRDNPVRNPKRAEERRNYVLRRLHELHKIDDFAFENAVKAPVTSRLHVTEVEMDAPYVSEMARQQMVKQFGKSVYESGYNVYLTIDSGDQRAANLTLREGLLAYDRRHGYRGPVKTLDPDTQQDASLVAAELAQIPASHEIVPAMVTAVAKQSFRALTRDGSEIEVGWEGIKWARKHLNANSLGPAPKQAGEVVSPGDIVHVAKDEEKGWQLSQLPNVSGALVSLSPHDGAILSLAGGFDYYLSKFNRATQARRQPGSNIKPFIYSAALDKGFSAASLVSGAPIVIEDVPGHLWRPENYSKKFFGPTRLRRALSLSLNLVSVRLLRYIGVNYGRDHLEKFGFERQHLPGTLSLALGSASLTPLEIAAGFATFASGGMRVKPHLIQRIENQDGNLIPLAAEEIRQEIPAEPPVVVVEAEPATDGDKEEITDPNRAISAENAFLTTSMMQQVIRSGTAKKARSLERNDIAGKTGTTNNFVDAWFSGFTPDLETTVWVGFDTPAHLGKRESGATAALPIWIDYMRIALEDIPENPITPPPGITTRFVNKKNGRPTSKDDPNGYQEYFMAGTVPSARPQAAYSRPVSSAAAAVTEDLF